MGKACIRCKKLDDIVLGVMEDAIRLMPADRFVSRYLAVSEKWDATVSAQ